MKNQKNWEEVEVTGNCLKCGRHLCICPQRLPGGDWDKDIQKVKHIKSFISELLKKEKQNWQKELVEKMPQKTNNLTEDEWVGWDMAEQCFRRLLKDQ